MKTTVTVRAPMGFLRPPDDRDVVYEFFAPFAHVPGKYEWCRIRSSTHGIFDVFILLAESTSAPATVYASGPDAQRFMKERFPECTTFPVGPRALILTDSRNGLTVRGSLRALAGPIRTATFEFRATPGAMPQQSPYGGKGKPVWGSRYTCWGVDLALDARVEAVIVWADKRREVLRGAKGILTVGSFGRIAPLRP